MKRFTLFLALLFLLTGSAFAADQMKLSAEDKAILAHVVIDPDAWVSHALEYSKQGMVEDQKQLDGLNALIAIGKQIDPRQKEALEKRLLVNAEDRAVAFVAGKVATHRGKYLAAKDLPGYKTRAEREADAERKMKKQ